MSSPTEHRIHRLPEAEALRASLIAQAKDETIHGPTVAECAEKYIASRRHELGEKTIGQHRLLLDRLTKFCEARHAPYMRNLTVDLLETFKTEGLPKDMADTSKATAVAKLRCFLRTRIPPRLDHGIACGQSDRAPGRVRTEGTVFG